MCGLVGVAGDTTAKWKDVFTDLLIIDSVRGMHGTGVAAVKRYESRVAVVKAPGPSHYLILTEEYQKLLKEPIKCLIGHNRYATIGEHSAKNSHPFEFEKVVGAHNGTLDKWAIKRLHEWEKYGTDSEALYANMSEFGLPATVDKLEGAWALTWYDRTNNTINFLRNEKRPLFYTYSKDRTTLIWASEICMLEFVLKRAHEDFDMAQCYVVDADNHLSWVIPNTVNDKFGGPTKTECKPPPPPARYWEAASYGTWREEENESTKRVGVSTVPWRERHSYKAGAGDVIPFPNGGTSKSTTTTSTKKAVSWRQDEAQRFRPPYKDATGKVLNKKAFNDLIADGCVYCDNSNIKWGEFIKCVHDTDGRSIFLCKPCFEDDEIFELCKSHLLQ